MTLLLGRQGELLAQLRELLTMPSSPPANKLESYYRCTRQGCAAKWTVQRNDDADDGGAAPAAPKYTVVRVGEHTCTANDSAEAPVILETTAVVVPASCTSNNITIPTASSAAAVASCSTTTAATESPATSDNTLNSSSSIASSEYYCYVDDDSCHGLLAAVHDNEWVPALGASSPSSFPTIENFAGPIRSPVHISAADGWTIDHQFLLQLVNEPTICQHLEV
ncbi:uncharacterized protein [Miscanthus floridulus]|uniref:uncharacterized protein n=1 Tax=Miscanthus floridulus TaxID=154761 RepID=UPI00345AB135